jgi:hypothetical protein
MPSESSELYEAMRSYTAAALQLVSKQCPEGPNMATTSYTLVGNPADSPESILSPWPATDYEAEKLEVSDPDLGYDAETFPYQQPRRGMRPTFRAGLLRGLWGAAYLAPR